MRIGILGGSFNPIHRVHIKIAQNAIKAANLDKCLLVVANNPPHKTLAQNVSASLRFDTVCAALKGIDEPIFASNIEITHKLSYTVDMLKQLSLTKGFESAELYLIVGADMLASFLSWREPEKICKMLKGIIAVGRPDQLNSSDFIKSRDIITDAFGIDITLLDSIDDVSSTKIRERVSSFQSVQGLLPYEAERFILEHGLYQTPKIQSIISELKTNLSYKRFCHSISTMREAILLAERYGADTYACGLSGLIHDCEKTVNNEPVSLCKKYGIKADEYELNAPFLLHAKLGEYKARTKYQITDERILNAILYHTVGSPDFDLIGKIVYVADKVEILRDYPEAKKLREIAYEDIDKAVFEVLKFNISKLSGANRPIHPATLRAIEFFGKK